MRLYRLCLTVQPVKPEYGRAILSWLSMGRKWPVSISVSGNNAFAKSEKCNTSPTYSLEVVNLICSVSTTKFAVVAFSSSANVTTTVTLTVNEDCAQALADLSSAGLKIKDIQSVAPNVVYILEVKSEDS